MDNKFSTLEEIRDHVIKCTECDLCKDRTKAVAGKGNPKSEIMFVGEAPGRIEDIRGEPFVGAAGKRFSEALEHVGLSRESVYITNVVKCRPPNNRVPTTKEVDSCKRYLRAEIELIKPKIICVMGNTAYKSLLGGGNITKHHGSVVVKEEQRFFLTIHPAATIYRQELFDVLKTDLANLVRIKDSVK